MEIFGFILAVVMGLTLGLLGGGGSILTVPILVYVLSVEPVLATAYSLFVVGSTALAGAAQKHRQSLVHWKTAFFFATPSLLAVVLTRYYFIPAIPDIIFETSDFAFTKDVTIMIFFAVIMLMASYSMIAGGVGSGERKKSSPAITLLLAEGFVVGIVTGLVGAGGGFLIVPALVLLVGLPIKQAIGTSLVIIAIKSLIGFLGDVGSGQDIQWGFLLLFTTFSVLGMFLGIYATRFISAGHLKKAFGWFVLLMAVFIILMEIGAL